MWRLYYRVDTSSALLIILGFTGILNWTSEWSKQVFANLRTKITESLEETRLIY